MARNESDREDLLREATTLVERIELKPIDSAAADPIVVGFRTDGAMSIFFGADPVYQFNAGGELRRAFCDGQLYKAVRGRLASLRRERQANEVQLVRRDLADAEQDSFLGEMTSQLQGFAEQLSANRFAVVGQVPTDADVLGRVRQWFTDNQVITVAQRPNVG
jgi:hypothetical protein